jgi:hypothetical protein
MTQTLYVQERPKPIYVQPALDGFEWQPEPEPMGQFPICYEQAPIQDALTDEEKKRTISFTIADIEYVRITPEGFYVRGTKVDQGPNEATIVYLAFLNYLQSLRLLPNQPEMLRFFH